MTVICLIFFLTVLVSTVPLSSSNQFRKLNLTLWKKYLDATYLARRDGFKASSPRENPYAVQIVCLDGTAVTSICTGTLLTPEWVLTAAHCFYSPDAEKKLLSDYMVYAGGTKVKEATSGKLPEGGQVLWSGFAKAHPKYNTGSYDYDVALIKVKRGGFKITEYVKTINLTVNPWPYHKPTSCVVTGFGTVQLDEKNELDNARKTHTLDIKQPCDCANILLDMLHSRMSKAWSCSVAKEDFGLCTGDSGGGLVCDGMLHAVATSVLEAKDVKTCNFEKLGEDHIPKCGSENTLTFFTSTCTHIGWVLSLVDPERALYLNISPLCVVTIDREPTDLGTTSSSTTIISTAFIVAALMFSVRYLV